MHQRADSKRINFLQILLIILFAMEFILAIWINLEVRDTREYQRQISLGNKYLEELDYENAELCYRKAIEIDKRKVEPYLKIANASAQQGDYDKANEILVQARESIPESSDRKQEMINQQEEIFGSSDYDSDEEDEVNDVDEEDEEDDETRIIDAHKTAEEVTGYTYLGGREYDLSYIRNTQNTELQMGVPHTEPIGESGYISAQQYDFDKDGQDEILVVALDLKKDTQTQMFVLHMLEQYSDNIWEDAAVLELTGDTAKMPMSTLAGIAAMERLDFFIKENRDEIPLIYIESYGSTSYFVDGETWGLTQIQYQSENFIIGDGNLSTSGSDIGGCMTLNEKNSSIENDIYRTQFIADFKALNMQAPAYLGFYTPLVYEDENLIYMAGCRKMGTVSSETAIDWKKGNEEKLQALRLTLRDYTSEEGEKAGKAGAAFTKYIREYMPDAWYTIVDIDKRPVLLTAGNTECEERPWWNWIAYSDSAEVFLYEEGEVVSAGNIEATKGVQLYYAVQKVTAVTEAGIKSYQIKDKELVEEESIYPYNFVYRLEFHRCRQKETDEIGDDAGEPESAASDIRIGTYRKGDAPDTVPFKGSYSVNVLAVEGDKMHLIVSYTGRNYSPVYDAEVTDAVVNGNTVTFDWVDSWTNEGYGELAFHGDTVTVNMQVTKSADFNRSTLAADALELTYAE